MKNRDYYTLVASLPHLPRFDKAERLPISRERLLQRMTMLEPKDLKLAYEAAEFIAWRRQPIGRTNQEVIASYNRFVGKIFESPLLRTLFEFSVNQRTIMAALRLRKMGYSRPTRPWGAGHLVRHIEHHWEDATFKLGNVFPWIEQAKMYLKEGESLKLDYLLMNLMWDKLDWLLFKSFFGFEVVLAYLLKWDMIQQWLAYNKVAAKARFEEMVSKIIEESQLKWNQK